MAVSRKFIAPYRAGAIMYIEQPFNLTAAEVARAAGLAVETVRDYESRGLLTATRLTNGTRLFRASAVDEAREVYRSRMANRGRKRA